ncbi:porin family protein [Hymenobacter convexus]|uniref:porin family protein n=1 Tax=Hymenobacter sp. CA1UV-4 TaxID=3063782 RepID=UPI0027123BD9|nr:porin family protein [Hymenobacter sp. CA1UV-4]MDO7853278.1 porin family protein [Hymenobacter sp. CA1UV-4]
MVSTSAVFAQQSSSDYLVKTNGDTLRGRVQLNSGKGTIRLFRPGQPAADFSAGEARSYGGARGPAGVSRLVGRQGTPHFVVPLVEGPVSLFAGENEQRDKRFYLQVPDSSYVIEVQPLTYQLTLARQLGDCTTLEIGSNAFQRRYPYSQSHLAALVMDYNRCRTPQAPSHLVKHDSGLRAAWGVKAGINSVRFDLNVPSFANGPHTGTVGYQAGLMLNLYGRSHFSAQMEAVYTTLRSAYGQFDLYAYNSGSPTNTVTANVHYSQVQLPLLLRYSVGHGVFRPFVNAGPLVAVNFGNTSTTSFPLTKMADQPIETGTLNYGYAAGAGAWLKLPALPALTAELRYSQLENNGEKVNFNAYNVVKCQLIRLDVGLLF